MIAFSSHLSPRRITRRNTVDYFAPKFNLFLTLILFLFFLFLLLFLALSVTHAQVITVDKNGNFSTGNSAPVDRRFAQIQPTNVDLPKASLNSESYQALLRALISEQGFAMRPFPRGHRGLELVANGKLKPAGEDYVTMVTQQGLAAKPGERLLITNIKIENNKIIFDFNGGPDPRHRFLRHISIGMGPDLDTPIVQGDEQAPTGARLTLAFKSRIPQLTPDQVKALLAPLISFGVKSPLEAFTDTLPPVLKAAILDHHVLVGMSTEMVLFTVGEPLKKSREMDGQMPFEEWIYGQPPADVEFVRVNGNRVIQVEIAKVGYPPRIYTKDEVAGLMRTDGSPIITEKPKEHTIQLGDVYRDPNTQSPAPAPSLANPGEKIDQLPEQQQTGKVRFPKHDDSTNTTGTSAGNGTETSSSTPNTTSTAPSAPTTQQPSDQGEDQKPNHFLEGSRV